jgi:hypothetical protein
MALKAPSNIDRIITIDDDSYAVVLDNKDDATLCLRRNPRAFVMEEDGQHILVYSKNEIDLTRAIKRL